MKRLLLAACVSLSLAAGSEDMVYPKGQRPDASRLGFSDGKRSYTVADFKGKIVVVDFWAIWCGPCRRSLPETTALQQQGDAKGTLVVVPVNMDDEGWPKLTQFINQNKPYLDHFKPYRAAVGEHGPAATVGEIHAFPTVLVIDREGGIAYRWSGYGEGLVVQRVNELMREQP